MNADNIKEVLGSEATTFVKFYAPWCGHCKNMAPEYIKFAAKYADASGIQIAEMDCTAKDTRGACSDYGVSKNGCLGVRDILKDYCKKYGL